MEKMEVAKARLLLKHVFFGTPVISTPMVKTDQVPTAGTDMEKIYWNPAWFADLSIEEHQFVLAHEVMHILLKHGFRRGTRDPQLWNVACDHVINRILLEAKCGSMPTGEKLGVVDPQGEFKGMSEEQIYEKLKQQAKSGRKPGKGGMGGDILPLPGNLGADQIEVIKRQIDQKLAQAVNMARMAGKVPGEMERLFDRLLNPAVPWQDVLRDYVTRITQDDESWLKRNRRFQHVYIPARHNERMAGLTVIGDTSGSIGPDDFARIGTELKAIIEDVSPEFIRVLWADTRTASIQVISPDEFTSPATTLKPKGGGGTDMRVPLKDAEEYEPPVVILITDGYTPWPDCEPPYPLIVVCTTDQACPVGQVVRV